MTEIALYRDTMLETMDISLLREEIKELELMLDDGEIPDGYLEIIEEAIEELADEMTRMKCLHEEPPYC